MEWLKTRRSGLLLHVSALPCDHGIGNIGQSALQWLQLLKDCGASQWQICPIGPTGFGNSPYSSLSAFAGNPLLLDFEDLLHIGLIEHTQLKELHSSSTGHVDFLGIEPLAIELLKSAHRNFLDGGCRSIDGYGDFETFKVENNYWLEPYCRYRALKTHFDEVPWYEWPIQHRDVNQSQKHCLEEEDLHYVQFHQFQQYLFFGQWNRLMDAARTAGIEIIGDSPFFVSHDSADTWAHPEIFALDESGQTEFRAGVPPDYFSESGQLWGNPVYRWNVLKANNYRWWMQRLKHDLERFSALRLDHFRAFHNYWSIPPGAQDACTGNWELGPGLPFFEALRKEVGEPHIISEDLGEMIPEVYELRDATGFPGMKVLQFAFCGDSKNPHLPHNYETANCVVFPGTHDNDTSSGWYASAPEEVRDNYRRYLSVDGRSPSWDLIRTASASVARMALYPMQDLLSLGTESRFNTPGVAEGNWSWRVTNAQLDHFQEHSADYLRELTQMHGRLPQA